MQAEITAERRREIGHIRRAENQSRKIRYLWGAVILLVIYALIVSAIAIDQYSRLEQIREALENLSSSFSGLGSSTDNGWQN